MPTTNQATATPLRGGPPITVAPNDAFRSGPMRSQPNATDANQVFSNAVQQVIGTGATFEPVTSVSLDTREGYARSTTGIPYAISGTATVVSQVVGEWLAGYEDPIKAILPTSVHKEAKIIIKRKYVVGGSATIVPERAPARTVALKEDVREVELTRYGCDVEMNLNLFLTPDIAKEELTMKLDAQKRELSRKLTDLSYQMLMREGTDITQAILRSTPGLNKSTADHAAAHRIYSQSIFGALNKNAYGVSTLLSAARYASAYSCGSARGSVMIIPHGVPDILRYARPEKMTYSISGAKHSEMPKIDMEMQGAYEDNASGVRILVHYPVPHYSRGTVAPEVKMGGLSREVWVVSRHHHTAAYQIANLKEGGFVKAPAGTVYRAVKCVATSAILAAPGSQTGEMLIGYPFTGVSTSHSEERMRIQLRVYLGSVLYNPENVLIMPNAFVENVTEQFFFTCTAEASDRTGSVVSLVAGAAAGQNLDQFALYETGAAIADNNAGQTAAQTKNVLKRLFKKKAGSFTDGNCKNTAPGTDDSVRTLLQKQVGNIRIRDGAVFDRTGKLLSVNTGEFGVLDDPVKYTGLNGAPQPFQDLSAPSPFNN